MNSQTKQCQNCKRDFVIEPDDFDFYEKIKVPPPSWCPECRLVRRMVWRNERALYKRSCDSCKGNIISIYQAKTDFPVYCQKCWWKDDWNPMEHGQDYDFNNLFFEQFKKLLLKIPAMALFNTNAVDSDFCNYAGNHKNCYLATAGRDNENVLYSNQLCFSKDSLDSYNGNKLELCYWNVYCENSYRLLLSENCEGCSNSIFLYDCRNCQHCFGCSNLRNKQYHIFNCPYTKEKYFEIIKQFDIGSDLMLQAIRAKFAELCLHSIYRHAHLVNSPNSTGNNLHNAKSCNYCFGIRGNESNDSKFTHYVAMGVNDSYDTYGLAKGERLYETIAIGFETIENSNYFFSYFIKGSHSIYYSYNCVSCSNLFACIGLRNKQYCILNKQYTKEEYEALVPKIIQHMNDMPYIDKKGRVYKFGEFFPPELSPFCYNETIAQEYFALSEAEAESKGFRWKKPEPRNYQIDIKTDQLPDSIEDVKDDIIGKVIECQHQDKCNEQCTEAFKIIEPELQFYRRMNLPLPRLCPNCRHYQRLKQRNPLKLWKRQCMCAGTSSRQQYRGLTPILLDRGQTPILAYHNTCSHEHGDSPCPNTFETSYAPDRPEIVYCEECYLKEVV